LDNISENESFDNPYNHALNEIVRLCGQKGVYFNLAESKSAQIEHLPKLLNRHKNYENINVKLSEQLDILFNFKISNRFPLIEDNFELILAHLFEALMQTAHTESRNMLFKMLIRIVNNFSISDALKDNKINSNYNLFFINKLTELSRFMSTYLVNDTQEINESENEDENSLNLFTDLVNLYGSFVYTKIKPANHLLKPILDLTTSFLQVPHINDVNGISYLLRLEKFFNLSNYSNETILLLNGIIKLVYRKDEIKSIDDLVYYFIERVKVFKKVLENLYPILFDQIVCKPIEEQIEILREPYKKNLNSLLKLFSFELYQINEAELNRLKQLIDLIVTDEIFQTMQAESCAFYYQPACFYWDFFQELSKGLAKRNDILEQLEEPLLKLFDKFILQNEFYNEFYDSNNPRLINYFIFQFLFIDLISKNINTPHSIVKKLLEICFLIRDQELSIEMTDTVTTFIQLASLNYSSQVACYSEKIWSYFLVNRLNSDEYSTFMQIICQNFELYLNEFKDKQLDIKLHDKFMNDFRSNPDKISQCYSLFVSICQYYPEYFLTKSKSKNIRIVEVIKLGLEKENANFSLFAFNTLNQLIEVHFN
jgi:hypothetical protein